MEADIRWLDDPRVFRVGQSPAHSDHVYYENRESLEAGNFTLRQCLNGEWQFCFSVNAGSRPADFYREDYDRTGWDGIPVPMHIEMAGYDKIHYINVVYPWEGKMFRRPACTIEGTWPGEAESGGDGAQTAGAAAWEENGSFSRASYNPVGSYVKVFDLEPALRGKPVKICFEGVEQAMYLWLNGRFIGYAEDSFTPSEFDLTPYIRERGNVLAVEVHKRSTASYLEDQDFFRFFGIFRSVYLYAWPGLHVEDLWAKPRLLGDNTSGSLELELRLAAWGDAAETLSTALPSSYRVGITLEDGEGRLRWSLEVPAARSIHIEPQQVGSVTPWNNHNPCLYRLLLTLLGPGGEVLELVPCEIGFRRIEIVDKVIMLNGKRLIFTGVNRHEWSAKGGRVITTEDMERDIRIFEDNNINAVRTSHYPNQIPWYGLCDRHGIYMISETNLETHGSWQKPVGDEPSWNIPGSFPAWREAVLDRARTHFETFKNHPAILMWSLGNESFAGENIAAMNAFFKERDPDRLVHYEGVVHNREYEDRISDVESQMYTGPEGIAGYLSNAPKKPFILCEYMHDMGNSLGGMQSYMDLLDRFEMYQGGFIWDYMDQAILAEDPVTGREVLRYGGDFDDRPSDYEFSGDGILFADRTPKPALQEVRYYYGKYR
ncbi:beta-galactosidase large subunit [Lachnospiraceae bacterium]|nr:beta-galactosidase [Acetatifactor sp.]GFH97136.1 beta-galactosidase large subunit [Lachnospiraceae bacterium]